MIHVSELKKTFTTYERGGTFREALLSLFVRKRKTVDAVKGISFDIKEGELVGFLGPNGAGKSTTIKILTGILYPTSGTVDVMGFVPWKERKNMSGTLVRYSGRNLSYCGTSRRSILSA